MDERQDEYYMRMALNEAMNAYDAGEVPVGAVIVLEDKIIARGHNLTETLRDVTAHAEIMAITAGENGLGAKYLRNCTLYVTLEPCVMCAGALVQCRVERIVFGAKDPKGGGCKSLYEIPQDPRLSHRCCVTGGVLAHECAEILRKFFEAKRKGTD